MKLTQIAKTFGEVLPIARMLEECNDMYLCIYIYTRTHNIYILYIPSISHNFKSSKESGFVGPLVSDASPIYKNTIVKPG